MWCSWLEAISTVESVAVEGFFMGGEILCYVSSQSYVRECIVLVCVLCSICVDERDLFVVSDGVYVSECF